MLVQDFHALEHDVAPLMALVGISLALHENIEQARTAGFQADNRIGHALIRISRFFMLHVRIRHNQRSKSLNDSRIFDHRRHRDVRHLQGFNSRDALDAL